MFLIHVELYAWRSSTSLLIQVTRFLIITIKTSNRSFQETFLLKEHFTHKIKFNHYLLAAMLVESQVKFLSPQNIPGVSQNSIAASSWTTEEDRKLF